MLTNGGMTGVSKEMLHDNAAIFEPVSLERKN
jgi:hypothetical protein